MAWNPNIPTVTNRVQDDLAAIRENFRHLAPLAPYIQAILDSRIVDHNLDVADPPNGWYVRYECGLQECWFSVELNRYSDKLMDYLWTFPAAFAALPTVVGIPFRVVGHPNPSNEEWERLGPLYGGTWGTTQAGVNIRTPEAFDVAARIRVHLVAKGRWM